MFQIKQEFIGVAFGNEIRTPELYWALYNAFYHLVEYYADTQFDKQALCTDLLSAIRHCWYKTELLPSEIAEELISCVDEEVPLNQLKLRIYDETRFFDELNEKFANDTYLIKE